jgi:serine/threonine protein kinase
VIGSRIGPYSIVSELGSGGMGKVYRAEVAGHAPGLDDGSRVALKVIHPHLLETPGLRLAFDYGVRQ